MNKCRLELATDHSRVLWFYHWTIFHPTCCMMNCSYPCCTAKTWTRNKWNYQCSASDDIASITAEFRNQINWGIFWRIRSIDGFELGMALFSNDDRSCVSHKQMSRSSTISSSGELLMEKSIERDCSASLREYPDLSDWLLGRSSLMGRRRLLSITSTKVHRPKYFHLSFLQVLKSTQKRRHRLKSSMVAIKTIRIQTLSFQGGKKSFRRSSHSTLDRWDFFQIQLRRCRVTDNSFPTNRSSELDVYTDVNNLKVTVC